MKTHIVRGAPMGYFTGSSFFSDEQMNISEEKPVKDEMRRKPTMSDPCYYCLCNSCVNNVENMRIIPEELPYDWNPCFLCDECIRFDSERHKNMEMEKCERYIIDNYHAARNRKEFKVYRHE